MISPLSETSLSAPEFTLTNTPFIDAMESSQHCVSKRDIYQGRGNWLSIVIMFLAVYSSVFSGLWLLIAITKPRYGQRITSNPGKLASSTASLLFAAFAKTIELSFVTVFVAFLGQVLSRRALVKNSRGITIAEMSMRSWVMQPGTMITHFESVRYAGATFLGAIALTGAVMAMLYTTASDALGRSQSQLSLSRKAQRRHLAKLVSSLTKSSCPEAQVRRPGEPTGLWSGQGVFCEFTVYCRELQDAYLDQY